MSSSTTSSDAATTYVRWFLGALGAALVVVALVNLVVLPEAPLAGWAPGLAEARSYGGRPVKIGELERGTWDTLIFGDSRAHAGCDPTDPVWAEGATYNAALPATLSREVLQFARVVTEHGAPRTAYLIYGVNIFEGGLGGAFGARLEEPTLESRLSDVLGEPNFRLALETLERASLGERGTTMRNGMRHPYDPPDTRHAVDRVIAQYRFVSRRFRFKEERWAEFEQAVDRLARHGVEVHLAVPPVHGSLLVAFRSFGLESAHYEYLRRLSDLAAAQRAQDRDVTAWNFAVLDGPMQETIPAPGDTAPMAWFFESSHFRPVLGRQMALRMRGLDDVDSRLGPHFGEALEPDGVERVIARLERELTAYMHAHPDVVAIVGEPSPLAPGTGAP